ncbi:hypothetical protein D7Z94_01430 [Ulvibacterium marinum]|uniref:Uncharacterized protein n=1 Tax=Ulvibacterium marinum TaxID=2419782 RepID=A0A3B0CH93_9FLAO|nr:hypothetical protein D7Z94_01430 [Ulvibacterium marinum]
MMTRWCFVQAGFTTNRSSQLNHLHKVKLIKRTQLSIGDKRGVLGLWNYEYEEKLNYETLQEFEIYLESLTEQFHNSIKAWKSKNQRLVL